MNEVEGGGKSKGVAGGGGGLGGGKESESRRGTRTKPGVSWCVRKRRDGEKAERRGRERSLLTIKK